MESEAQTIPEHVAKPDALTGWWDSQASVRSSGSRAGVGGEDTGGEGVCPGSPLGFARAAEWAGCMSVPSLFSDLCPCAGVAAASAGLAPQDPSPPICSTLGNVCDCQGPGGCPEQAGAEVLVGVGVGELHHSG